MEFDELEEESDEGALLVALRSLVALDWAWLAVVLLEVDSGTDEMTGIWVDEVVWRITVSDW